jgi:phosphoglycerol transferase
MGETRWREWHLYLLTVVVTCVVTYFALQLWDANLAIPFQYDGDALPTAAHFKDTIATGWYDFNPLLGAPFGQTFNDYPEADNLPMVFALLLSVFTHSWQVVLNVFYLLGYPLIAASSLWFLRRLGISRLISMALAVAYAIAPYHFFRSESHLFLGSYFVVPLSLALVMMVVRGERLWGVGRSRNRAVAWILGPTSRTALIIALTGTAEAYYCAFFLVLLAVAAVFRLVHSRNGKRFFGAVVAGAAGVAALLINELPNLIFSWRNGPDADALTRVPADTEVYALKLTQLLLPWSGSRIGLLQEFRSLYDTTYPIPSEEPALGALAAAGLIALFLLIAYRATNWGRRTERTKVVRDATDTLGQLGMLTFVAFIVSTIGGLATFVSFVTDALRGWNRISIFIALLCLAAVGVLIDLLLARLSVSKLRAPSSRRAAGIAVTALVIVIAFIDQTPSTLGAGYAVTAAAYKADDVWIKSIQSTLPPSALVLELPYQPFPESDSSSGVNSDDQDIPFLHSDTLRWTGGGIKGRPRSDWPGTLATYSGTRIVKLAAASGVDGIEIDRLAYGPGWSGLEKSIGSALGTPPTVSADDRYTFFSLIPYQRRLKTQYSASTLAAIRSRVLNPLDLSTAANFAPVTNAAGQTVPAGQNSRPKIIVTNASKATVKATLTLSVEIPAGTGGATALQLTLPDGTTARSPFVGNSTLMQLPIGFNPGSSALVLQLIGNASGSNPLILIDRSTLRESAIDRFLAE